LSPSNTIRLLAVSLLTTLVSAFSRLAPELQPCLSLSVLVDASATTFRTVLGSAATEAQRAEPNLFPVKANGRCGCGRRRAA
jgi:hypothetical protein